ncbi:DUF4012 domain-containing protein [Herbiconiux sp. KACC 21604]|uniref:DUF4012 domain-containing protein n=1 Tax=unclassified Herbiconiux TaxID=2618217 RepID=UPI001491D23A|nr:DUF4012 domain-containing protein [Herbiconiux sp. SALV-R1]QJU54569.1 DUF4012 domain-containing protein [Herbiconiux sp. SALV-R1]WPO85655.1 DUF4012 domain-containing protein [Herbiconiux sp. KACC 21604]
MTDDTRTRRSDRAAQAPRKRGRRRRWPWVVGSILILLLAIVGGVAWVGLNALTVKNELEAARPLLSSIKEKVLVGEAASAQEDADQLKEHVDAARDAVGGPAWALGELVPEFGQNLVAVRTITESVANVVDNAVLPAVALGDTLSPEVFKPVDGAVNLDAIQSVLPVLDTAGSALTSARASVSAIDTSSLVAPVRNAVDEINDLVGEVEPAIATAKSLAPVLPGLLGGEGTRNYLLVFENSAEARPLGGIAGAQILITADQGRVSIAQQTTGRDFEFESEEFANAQVGRAARELFLVPFGLQSQNNTLTPRVDVAANLTRAMWQNQRGIAPDTVIFIDPNALSYILGATGPITLPDGSSLTEENAIDILMNRVYQQFSDDADAQDAYFAGAASTMFSTIMNGDVDIEKFVTAVQRAGGERRLLVSSIDETIQGLAVEAGLQGRMPAETEAAHEIGVYASDYLGGKMDYYLRTGISVGQQQCADGRRILRVQVDATNVLQPGAVEDTSLFITGTGNNAFRIPRGDLRIFAYVYAPVGSQVLGISGTTSQEDSYIGSDVDYPVARAVIQTAPGQTETAVVDIDVSDLSPKQVNTLVAPMLYQPEVTELEFSC